ncbi:MAG: hypothetical protein ACOX6P_10675 [Candidatus Merdivicinus sp.]|jgi:hypothetical protein
MNRKIILSISAAAAGILLVAGIFYFSALRVPAESAPPSSNPDGYILREYNGQLAVFAWGEETPRQVIELNVEMLPPYDQGLLRAGIEAADEQELARLLEDYTS